MATKWKNNRGLTTVWILLFTYGLIGISIALNYGPEKHDYFRNYPFEHQLNQFLDNLAMLEFHHLTENETKKWITVSDEEINEHRYRYGDLAQQLENIKGQYENRIRDAVAAEQHDVVEALVAERDRKLEDITNNFKSDDHIRVKIVKEKEKKIEEFYKEREQHRSDYMKYKSVFLYHFKNIETGEEFTNIVNPNEIIAFERNYPSASYHYLTVGGAYGKLLSELSLPSNINMYEGRIAVPKSSELALSVLPGYDEFQQRQKVGYWTLSTGLVSLFVILKKVPIHEGFSRWQTLYNRIPLDIGITAFGFIGLMTLFFLGVSANDFLYNYSYQHFWDWILRLAVTTVLVALTLMQGSWLWTRVRKQSDMRVEWRKTILARTYFSIKEVFLVRHIGTQLIILLFFVFSLGAGFLLVMLKPRLIIFYAPYALLLGIPALFVIIKRAGYFNRIVLCSNQWVLGNLEVDLPVTGNSSFAKLAENMNKLKHGVRTSINEQAKSERLKTELITNVSHDLRTPLTSIISYTELLKREDLSNEDRQSYIDILDRKSKRLKVLIDDLFEATKMASGNIQLVKDRVDLVQLLQQALAEYNEKIEESTLQLRVVLPDKPVYARVDGQKIWRVFENLIGNFLKYSLEQTRVYITMKTNPQYVVITFKNVAKYELGENVEELFERFKRGDSSRNTEGSGLGLAIAKSIIDLHDGSMEMEVDGDLFKVTITLAT
ncbi:sensor histidine kinase KdpD [Ammoniphilus sp. YIM 78166]|uniref:sensor histidine kinase n=1 Tax=Ammoniphilus sp. YIM 78166 TaxID=1644106 RepID=UPI00106F2A5E|nr:HAMP domain-containing sensor histidine kinase [Ammoniphilus sp. YIM 78166]